MNEYTLLFLGLPQQHVPNQYVSPIVTIKTTSKHSFNKSLLMLMQHATQKSYFQG